MSMIELGDEVNCTVAGVPILGDVVETHHGAYVVADKNGVAYVVNSCVRGSGRNYAVLSTGGKFGPPKFEVGAHAPVEKNGAHLIVLERKWLSTEGWRYRTQLTNCDRDARWRSEQELLGGVSRNTWTHPSGGTAEITEITFKEESEEEPKSRFEVGDAVLVIDCERLTYGIVKSVEHPRRVGTIYNVRTGVHGSTRRLYSHSLEKSAKRPLFEIGEGVLFDEHNPAQVEEIRFNKRDGVFHYSLEAAAGANWYGRAFDVAESRIKKKSKVVVPPRFKEGDAVLVNHEHPGIVQGLGVTTVPGVPYYYFVRVPGSEVLNVSEHALEIDNRKPGTPPVEQDVLLRLGSLEERLAKLEKSDLDKPAPTSEKSDLDKPAPTSEREFAWNETKTRPSHVVISGGATCAVCGESIAAGSSVLATWFVKKRVYTHEACYGRPSWKKAELVLITKRRTCALCKKAINTNTKAWRGDFGYFAHQSCVKKLKTRTR